MLQDEGIRVQEVVQRKHSSCRGGACCDARCTVQVPGLYTLKAELPEYVDDEVKTASYVACPLCTYTTYMHTCV